VAPTLIAAPAIAMAADRDWIAETQYLAPDGSEFTIDSGVQEMTVDTALMPYDPMDQPL